MYKLIQPLLLIASISMLSFVFSIALADTDNEQQPKAQRVIDGELLLPDDYEHGQEKKKCLTVCKEWGENCILNPSTGSRKCRRVCQSFIEECF